MKRTYLPRMRLAAVVGISAGICLFLLLFSSCSKNDPGLSLIVNPFAGNSRTEIKCIETEDGIYTLFLPSETDRTKLYVRYSGGSLRYGDEVVPNKTITDFFSSADEFLLCRQGERFNVRLMQSEHLPAVFIEAERPLGWLHGDKSNKSSGNITIVNSGSFFDLDLEYIKGRGNSTWNVDPAVTHNGKRPYNIKLTKSGSLLGMSEAKKYCLLANVQDRTLIKNTVAMELACEMGVSSALECRQIDLYINGDYRGNYLLTESVGVGEGRVDINDTEELNEAANASAKLTDFPLHEERDGDIVYCRWREMPFEAEKDSWAFLLEQDVKNVAEKDLCLFFSNASRCIALKNPENASREQVETATAIYCDAEDALYSGTGYNPDGRHYSELINVDSVVRAYLLQELVVNLFGCSESMFFYIPENSRTVFMGPVWDFDLTSCERDYNIWCVCSSLCGGVSWFSAAFRHKDFRDRTAELWALFLKDHPLSWLAAYVNGLAARNCASAVMDSYRWGIASYSLESTRIAYQRLCLQLSHALTSRAQFMSMGYSEDAALIWYELEEGKYCMHRDLLLRGHTITVPSVSEVEAEIELRLRNYAYRDEDLLCWSTEPDGNGTRYFPGDEITVVENTTVLYAVWK